MELKRKKKRGAMTLEVNVKRQLSAEIGEDELPQGEKFILLQKYGVAAPRIDRLVTKPTWMEERLWRQKNNDWMRATKGLVPARQQPRTSPNVSRPPAGNPSQRTSKPWSQIKFKNPQAQQRHERQNQTTRTSRPN